MAKQQPEKKSFSIHDLEKIQPKTTNQEQAFYHYNSDTPILSMTGAAGTGKTLISLFLALRDVFDPKTDYKQVKLIRSAVPTRDIGFLPGSVWEKLEVYETPYMDICDSILKYKSKNYERLKELGYLSFDTTSYLRGLTFDNSIVIVDEFANMSFHELSSIMTRVGVNSRIIFSGDVAQNDLQIKNKDKTGFYDFMRVLENMENHVNVQFTTDDIVRSDIVAEYLVAKEKLGL